MTKTGPKNISTCLYLFLFGYLFTTKNALMGLFFFKFWGIFLRIIKIQNFILVTIPISEIVLKIKCRHMSAPLKLQS